MPEGTEASSEIVHEQSESVAATNLKTLGDGPAFFQNQSYQEAVAQTQAMNQSKNAVAGKVAEMIIHTSPSEGAASLFMAGLFNKFMGTTPPTANVPPGGIG